MRSSHDLISKIAPQRDSPGQSFLGVKFPTRNTCFAKTPRRGCIRHTEDWGTMTTPSYSIDPSADFPKDVNNIL
jgi:hypothetical protein